MDIDWIVGIMVFLVFVGWAFSFYFAVFQEKESNFEIASDAERGKVIDFLSTDVYEAPVKYNSADAVSNAVLKAKSVWYSGEKNSTKVFSGSNSLPCRISGDDLYWQADVANGFNSFAIKTADVNATMNCTGTFSIASSNLTVPWVFEKKTMISLTKIYEMVNMSYDDFRNSLGVNQHLRLRIEKASGEINYGRSAPAGPVNVDSKTSERQIFETSEKANITVAIW